MCFHFADIDNSGYVSDYELQDLFKEASLPLPGYKVREIIEKIFAVTDGNKDGKINFEEFVSVRRSFWTFLSSVFWSLENEYELIIKLLLKEYNVMFFNVRGVLKNLHVIASTVY